MELSNIDKKVMNQLVIMVDRLLYQLKKTNERCRDTLENWNISHHCINDVSYSFLRGDFQLLSSVVDDLRGAVGDSFYCRFIHGEIDEQLCNLLENMKLMEGFKK